MSTDDDAAWEDWLPKPEIADVERFKWAWNEAEREVVWTVSGPGDGGPTHEEQLRKAWGEGRAKCRVTVTRDE